MPRSRSPRAAGEICNRCGPYFVLHDAEGTPLVCLSEALFQAGFGVLRGEIVRVTAFGQSHLMVDARNEGAISRFRLKARLADAPLPLMFATVSQVRNDFFVSDAEETMLLAPDAGPVVLERKYSARQTPLAAAAAGADPARFPVNLPRTRLHKLLLAHLKSPVVAVEESAARQPGGRGLADFTLVLNCPAWPPDAAAANGIICGLEKNMAGMPQGRLRRRAAR